jgi:cytidine deaminase
MELNEKDQLLNLVCRTHHPHALLRGSLPYWGCPALKDRHYLSGVHVEAYIGRITLCAEAVAIGMAAALVICPSIPSWQWEWMARWCHPAAYVAS